MTNISENDIIIRKHYTTDPLTGKKHHYVHTNEGHELYLLLNGDVSFNIDGHLYKLSPYDLLIINNKEIHRTIINSNIPYERIYIYVNPSIISRLNFEKYNLLQIFENKKFGYGNKIEHDLVTKNGIPQYFEEIHKWSKSNAPEKSAMMLSILIQLIVKINNILPSDEVDEKVKDAANYNGKIYLILNYISSNLNKKITLDELEKNFHINKYYFCHLFKKVTGFTFTEYINFKKISLAKDLLEKGCAINTVCLNLGFEDYSNFYRIFKRIAGVSPQQFIEKHSNKSDYK